MLQLCCAYSQLSQYVDRFRQRLKAKNIMYIKQLLFILSNFIKALGGRFKKPHFQEEVTRSLSAELVSLNLNSSISACSSFRHGLIYHLVDFWGRRATERDGTRLSMVRQSTDQVWLKMRQDRSWIDFCFLWLIGFRPGFSNGPWPWPWMSYEVTINSCLVHWIASEWFSWRGAI